MQFRRDRLNYKPRAQSSTPYKSPHHFHSHARKCWPLVCSHVLIALAFFDLENMSYLAGASAQDVSREIQTVQEDIQNLSSVGDGDDQAQRQALLSSARKLVSSLETPGHVVARMSWEEPTTSASLRILIDLNTFKHMLEDNTAVPKQASKLAEMSGADPVLVQRLLKRVASSSPPLVEETGPDQYTPNRWTRAFADDVNTGTFTDVYVEIQLRLNERRAWWLFSMIGFQKQSTGA